MFVGAGGVTRRVLADTPANWAVTVIDAREERLNGLSDGVKTLAGDATSRLVLGRIGLRPDATVVVTVRDAEVAAEVARIARGDFGVQEIITLGAGTPPAERAGTWIHSDQILGNAVLTQLGCGHRAGVGQGELLHVTVLAGSPVIGRPLSTLARGDWLVALVYRGSAVQVPHGDTVLAQGDRVLIAGDPDELPTVGAYFRGGEPTFPAAWGANLGQMGDAVAPAIGWLRDTTTASEVAAIAGAEGEPGWLRRACVDADVGCLVVPEIPVPWLARMGMFSCDWANDLRDAQVPVWVHRGEGPPKRVLIAVGTSEQAAAIGPVAVDLARQAGVPLAIITVASPTGTVRPDQGITADVVRLARLHGLEPERIAREGNPVAILREEARPTDLLVAGHGPARRNTVFTPDISVFLLHKAPCATLLVPWRPAEGR